MGGRAQNADPAGAVFDHGQHVHTRPGQGDGLQEIARQQGVGVDPSPQRATSTWAVFLRSQADGSYPVVAAVALVMAVVTMAGVTIALLVGGSESPGRL